LIEQKVGGLFILSRGNKSAEGPAAARIHLRCYTAAMTFQDQKINGFAQAQKEHNLWLKKITNDMALNKGQYSAFNTQNDTVK
jgi:hypothetical protein